MDKSKTILYFRANGNLFTGYGHVIRSLALADMLRTKFECRFIIHNPDDFLKKEILKICREIIEIPFFEEVTKEAFYLIQNICKQDDFIVVDGYNFSGEYQRIIKTGCNKLICIDDTYLDHFYGDVVINHAEGVSLGKYKREWYTRVYLGSKYAFLRKPFYKAGNGWTETNVKLHKVFINLGGTDPKNYTLKALRKVLKIKNIHHIDLVIGALYPYKEKLLEIINSQQTIKINLHVNADASKMAHLMRNSSIGICSSSSVAYEYATVGGILFLYQTVLNQKNIFKFFIKEEIAFPVNSLLVKLKQLNSVSVRKEYFRKRKVFFSGNTKDNLKSIFDKLILDTQVDIRKATIQDMMTYFLWANDKEVRKNSINQEPISLETHKKWFQAKLNDKKTFLYFFYSGKIAIGQVRIDIVTEGKAEIGFSIDKRHRGMGYSEIILRKAIFALKSDYRDPLLLKGIIKINNTPSIKAFLNNGFLNKGIYSLKGESYYKLLLK
jgi:UDP-2,4-diacetamido-2,4,6-trideoxy-beta-L-altropyranose hydrolase